VPRTTRTAGARAAGARSAQFPTIERRYGKPVAHWLTALKGLPDARYATHMAYLQERHGFSRAHANTLVMYARGSTTTRPHATHEAYFAAQDARVARTMRAVFRAAQAVRPARGTAGVAAPRLEPVVAWKHPMLRIEGTTTYVFGVGVSSRHLLLNAFSTRALRDLADRLADYAVNAYTVRVPLDWRVDAGLVRAMVRARLAELAPARRTPAPRRTRIPSRRRTRIPSLRRTRTR
jgi:uncharacterized protein YdhG (YjbR/CyaY superfamily)